METKGFIFRRLSIPSLTSFITDGWNSYNIWHNPFLYLYMNTIYIIYFFCWLGVFLFFFNANFCSHFVELLYCLLNIYFSIIVSLYIRVKLQKKRTERDSGSKKIPPTRWRGKQQGDYSWVSMYTQIPSKQGNCKHAHTITKTFDQATIKCII